MAKKESDQPQPMREVFKDVLDTLHQAQAAPPTEEVDIDRTLEELERGLEELTQRADALYKATGMTKEQVEEYANNPSNFSKEEWEMLEQIRNELNTMRLEAESAVAEPAATDEEKTKEAKRQRRPQKKKWLQG